MFRCFNNVYQNKKEILDIFILFMTSRIIKKGGVEGDKWRIESANSTYTYSQVFMKII